MWKKIAKYYPPWLELIPLTLVIFTFMDLAFSYGELPDTIPSHFNAQGQPDGWSDKGIIIILSLMSLWLYLQNMLINLFLIIAPDDPNKVVNLSAKRKEKLGLVRLEQIRALAARMMMVTNCLLVILFAYLVRGTIQVALGARAGLGWELWLILGVMIAVIFFMTGKMLLLSRLPKGDE